MIHCQNSFIYLAKKLKKKTKNSLMDFVFIFVFLLLLLLFQLTQKRGNWVITALDFN